MIGYWLKGTEFIEVSGDRHIEHIWQFPEQFGFTIPEIKKVYRKFKEVRGSEGNSREYLVVKASELGWVRVRKYEQYWSIQCDNYRLRQKTIKNFVYWAIYTKKIMKRTDTVIIVAYKTDFREKWMASEYLKENKAIAKITPQYVRIEYGRV